MEQQARTGKSQFAAWAVLGGAVALAAGVGAVSSAPGVWFQSLRKPPFQPPAWVFGPAWTVLYGLMAWSAHRVWRRPASAQRSRALSLWGAQLAINAAWSPLFFGKHLPGWALFDIAVLVPTVCLYAVVARKVDRPAAWLMAPYLGWLGFATVLNASIVMLNRGRS